MSADRTTLKAPAGDGDVGAGPISAPGGGADPDALRSPARPAPGWRRNPVLRLLWFLAPVLTFVLLIAAWALGVVLFDVPDYLLPAPQDVLPRLWEDRSLLWDNSLVTIQEVLYGFGLTIITAIPLGLLIALSA